VREYYQHTPAVVSISVRDVQKTCAHTLKGDRELGYGWLSSGSGRRILGNQLGHDGRKLRTLAPPVGDAFVLQINRGRVGAGIVGADDLDRTAIAGAVLLNNHDTIIGLLGGANARQTNHHHGDTVPFKFQCSVRVLLGLQAARTHQAK